MMRHAVCWMAFVFCFCCFWGCERPDSRVITEAGPGERWMKTEHFETGEESLKLPFMMLIPEDWETSVQTSFVVNVWSPDKNVKCLRILAGQETGGIEKEIDRWESEWTDRRGYTVIGKKEMVHPLGNAVWIKLKREWKGHKDFAYGYLLFNEEQNYSWWLDIGKIDEEDEGVRVLDRAFWSLTLEKKQ